MLKDAVERVADIFLDVLNASLSCGTNKWKRSLVLPVQKIRKTKHSEEFRLVGIMP